MDTIESLTKRFEMVFTAGQSQILADAITTAYQDLVKTSDFNEMKEIVRDLAEAQQRTELSMDELVQAQQRTEVQMAEMARAVGSLAREVGGLSRGMSYALENEAYRALPDYLERTYGIKLTERIVRAEVDDQEINFLARGEQNGEPVYLVGEAKLQIDERRENRRVTYAVFDQLERQAQIVAEHFPGYRVVPLLVTHYARPAVLRQAESRSMIVVQSFDW